MPTRWWIYPVTRALDTVHVAALLLVGYAAAIVYPTLPSLEALTAYNPKIPLQIFSTEGYLIGEFGEERRALVKIADVPAAAAPGDPRRRGRALLRARRRRLHRRAARRACTTSLRGSASQGASTITMQVARNFFLSKEKTFTRKFNEALLAFKIEHSLTKDQILEIYINQIYLGQRAYGFASAAQVYFGKNLRDLNLAEIAMLAGLPKAPSRYNPVVNMQRAKERQLYVLRRMRELEFHHARRSSTRPSQKPILVRRDQPGVRDPRGLLRRDGSPVHVRALPGRRLHAGFKVYTTLSKVASGCRLSPPYAGACWTTTSATATAARRAISICRKACPRKHWKMPCRSRSKATTSIPRWCWRSTPRPSRPIARAARSSRSAATDSSSPAP